MKASQKLASTRKNTISKYFDFIKKKLKIHLNLKKHFLMILTNLTHPLNTK